MNSLKLVTAIVARIGAIVLAALIVTACAAKAQQADPGAMKKLKFLAGAWTCKVTGGPSTVILDLRYAFSPDGLWMTEFSQDKGTQGKDWAMQLWGYDVNTHKLVAYQFNDDTVATKSVDGWVSGVFVSHRDDNNATVSLKPVNTRSMQWIIESADQSLTVTEDCVRR